MVSGAQSVFFSSAVWWRGPFPLFSHSKVVPPPLLKFPEVLAKLGIDQVFFFADFHFFASSKLAVSAFPIFSFSSV